jgi:hypothetical protein
MAAATTEIDTPERPGSVTRYPMAAATIIYAGTMVALNAAGNSVPAADAANLRVVGRAEETVDNASGAAGDQSISVKEGVFKFANSATNAVDPDDRGKTCFVEDDNTVSEVGGTNSVKAGRVVDVDSDGVWVDTRVGAASVVPVADTITGAADLTALKTALAPILKGAGLIK